MRFNRYIIKENTMDNSIRMCCPCHFGLESVLKYEIAKIGGADIRVNDGKISFPVMKIFLQELIYACLLRSV